MRAFASIVCSRSSGGAGGAGSRLDRTARCGAAAWSATYSMLADRVGVAAGAVDQQQHAAPQPHAAMAALQQVAHTARIAAIERRLVQRVRQPLGSHAAG